MFYQAPGSQATAAFLRWYQELNIDISYIHSFIQFTKNLIASSHIPHLRVPSQWTGLNLSSNVQRYGYLPCNFLDLSSLVDAIDTNLFRSICANSHHLLYQLLQPEKFTGCNFRERPHHLTLLQIDSNVFRNNSMSRMLFTDIYYNLYMRVSDALFVYCSPFCT